MRKIGDSGTRALKSAKILAGQLGPGFGWLEACSGFKYLANTYSGSDYLANKI